MLSKVTAHQQIPPEATSLEIDLTKAIGLKPWQYPPAYWTGESMKPNLLPGLILPNKVFHGQSGQNNTYQKRMLRRKVMGTTGGGEPRHTKISWIS